MNRVSFSLAGRLTAGVLFSLLLCQLPAVAADRALLIGIGQYANPKIKSLPGIDQDLDRMDVLAERLGFRDRKRLSHAEATTDHVVKAIESWLIQGLLAISSG